MIAQKYAAEIDAAKAERAAFLKSLFVGLFARKPGAYAEA